MSDGGSGARDESELVSPDSRSEAPDQGASKIRPAFAAIGALLCLGLVYAGVQILIVDRLETSESVSGFVLVFCGLFSSALYVRWVRKPPMR